MPEMNMAWHYVLENRPVEMIAQVFQFVKLKTASNNAKMQ
jgi:hypothetical protein